MPPGGLGLALALTWNQTCLPVYLIPLTSHHRAGFDVMERHSALQQAGVLQQKQPVSQSITALPSDGCLFYSIVPRFQMCCEARRAPLRLRAHLQLDDSQQVFLGSVQDRAALTEEDGVRVPPGVHVVKHLRGCVLHRHTLLHVRLRRRVSDTVHDGMRFKFKESYFVGQRTGRGLVHGNASSFASHV